MDLSLISIYPLFIQRPSLKPTSSHRRVLMYVCVRFVFPNKSSTVSLNQFIWRSVWVSSCSSQPYTDSYDSRSWAMSLFDYRYRQWVILIKFSHFCSFVRQSWYEMPQAMKLRLFTRWLCAVWYIDKPYSLWSIRPPAQTTTSMSIYIKLLWIRCLANFSERWNEMFRNVKMWLRIYVFVMCKAEKVNYALSAKFEQNKNKLSEWMIENYRRNVDVWVVFYRWIFSNEEYAGKFRKDDFVLQLSSKTWN